MPDNVMVGRFGEVYVLDWGLAVSVRPGDNQRLPQVADIRSIAGTPQYMAPEMVAADTSRIGTRSNRRRRVDLPLTTPLRRQKCGMSGLVIVLVIMAILAVPVAGILAAIAIPSFVRYTQVAKMTEAKVNLRTLCTAEEAYFVRNNAYLPAGPAPSEVPASTQVDFPQDEAFAKLGFAPGKVRYQYRVEVRANGDGAPAVHAIAHGDLNGDGKRSTLELPCGGALQEERE